MIYWTDDRKFVEKEFIRMGFNQDARWRISEINKDFELCNTYPRFLIIPANFKDEDLDSVAKFRYFRRIPTAVWRHIKNGCFIVRSSQPTVGWFGWFRNDLDENLVQCFVSNNMPPNSEGLDNNDCEKQRYQAEDAASNIITPPPTTTITPKIDATTVINNQTDRLQDNTSSELEQKQLLNQHNNSHQQNNGYNSSSSKDVVAESSINEDKNSARKLSSDGEPESRTEKKITATLPKNDQPLNGVINGNGTTVTHDSTISNSAPVSLNATTKMLIIDARSYAAAMANRAKGGGCECSEYYQGCEVHFMNLANIHSIRKSYHAIRSVCEAYSEQSNNWVSFLDNSRWLHHISGLLKSALLVVDAIDIQEKSILIHCSDGWDRTPQLVALAEIMLDPYYRTFDGFRTLVQREWLDFGHKFADRCGSNPCNDDPNERCPVFLQWLDCVQQLLVQYPKHFEFNSFYLDKLNRHTYSNVFGTFSYNSTQERILSHVNERLLSLWSYFDSARIRYRNDKYTESDEVLRPSCKVRDLYFWKEVYMPPLRDQTSSIPVTPSNVENKKYYDSLYIDGLTRTVCK